MTRHTYCIYGPGERTVALTATDDADDIHREAARRDVAWAFEAPTSAGLPLHDHHLEVVNENGEVTLHLLHR